MVYYGLLNLVKRFINFFDLAVYSNCCFLYRFHNWTKIYYLRCIMWISVIYPNDDYSSSPQSYCEEVYFKSSPILPDECYDSPLLYRFFADDFFDEYALTVQGFHKCRKNVYKRSLTREDYLFVLTNILDFNWT